MNTEDQEAERALCAVMAEVMATVNELLGKRRYFTALVVLYGAIDVLGSLLRPLSQPDTSASDFKEWVTRYLLSNSSLPASADDLWAARCGLQNS